MSKNHISTPQAIRSMILVAILFVAPSGHASSAEPGSDPCTHATPVDLNSTLRAYSEQYGDPFLVKVEIPSAGILSVDVAVPGPTPAEPKLGLAASGCGRREVDSEPVFLERSASHLVLTATVAGTHVFRVASQDPLLPLGQFKLRTGFAPSQNLLARGGEDEDEIEIEPDMNRSLHGNLAKLCRKGEVDDHGDSFSCATFLSPGQETAGEVRNGWGDDDDIFLVVLGGSRGSRLWTLAIETSGDVDTFGGLYDRSGQRLASGDDGGSGANFRIVKTLTPGAYFVRVEGRHGAEGAYRLRAEASPW